MPRDASGNFTLVSGNPVTPGTTIEASWANTTLDDIAIGLTNSLSRSGQGGMTAPLQLPDGTEALPALTFTSGVNGGFYKATPAEVRYVYNGQSSFRWTGLSVPQTFQAGQWRTLLYEGQEAILTGVKLQNTNSLLTSHITGTSATASLNNVRGVYLYSHESDTNQLALLLYGVGTASPPQMQLREGTDTWFSWNDNEHTSSRDLHMFGTSTSATRSPALNFSDRFGPGSYVYSINSSAGNLQSLYVCGGQNNQNGAFIHLFGSFNTPVSDRMYLGVNKTDTTTAEMRLGADEVLFQTQNVFANDSGGTPRALGYKPLSYVYTTPGTLSLNQAMCTVWALSTSLNIPDLTVLQEGEWIDLWYQSTSTLTVGAGIVLYWLDGTTQQTGTRTLTNGHCRLTRLGGDYYIAGVGIS